MSSYKLSQSGFTLIEAIMVIVITGILGALVSSFASPLKGYFDATARADLSDVADTALRRMARDMHLALPNSIRVSGKYIELLPTTTGGRYRATAAPAGAVKCGGTLAQDILDFTPATTDTCFEVIGALPAAPAVGEELVVNNIDNIVASTGNAYVSNAVTGNVAAISAGSTVNTIMFTAKLFPSTSPGNRFQIIGKPVTYVCDTATATLWRYTGYARQAVQPITIATLDALTNVTRARLATGVDCNASRFDFTPSVGLVTMSLTLSNTSDSVTLLHQVHVQNVR